jgi:hypothetical protein
MALPNLPPATAQEELSDKAKALAAELAAVAKQMERMAASDAPALDGALRAIASRADGIGPILSKLFVLDPKGARGLKSQFQSIIDSAVEMAAKVKEKAESASQAARVAAEKTAQKQDANAKEQHDSTLRGAARGIRNLPSGGVGGAAAGALALAGPEGEVAAAAFSAVTQAVQNATDALSGFVTSSVQASNPALMERYSRAVEDLSAVFGQALSPVMETATEFTNEFNGILSEIAPIIGDIASEISSDFKPIMAALMELFQSLADIMKDIWGEAGSGFKTFAEEVAAGTTLMIKAVEYLIILMEQLGKQLASGAQTLDFGKAGKDASDAMGKAAKESKEHKKEKTFAARPASFESLEGLAQKAQVAAASAGTGGPATMEDNTAKIAEMMDKASQVLGRVMDYLGKIPEIANSVNLLAVGVSGAATVSRDILDNAAKSEFNPYNMGTSLGNFLKTF